MSEIAIPPLAYVIAAEPELHDDMCAASMRASPILSVIHAVVAEALDRAECVDDERRAIQLGASTAQVILPPITEVSADVFAAMQTSPDTNMSSLHLWGELEKAACKVRKDEPSLAAAAEYVARVRISPESYLMRCAVGGAGLVWSTVQDAYLITAEREIFG